SQAVGALRKHGITGVVSVAILGVASRLRRQEALAILAALFMQIEDTRYPVQTIIECRTVELELLRVILDIVSLVIHPDIELGQIIVSALTVIGLVVASERTEFDVVVKLIACQQRVT